MPVELAARSRIRKIAKSLPRQVQELFPREREVATIVYLRGRATAVDVQSRVTAPLSNGAVRSMLNRLVAKGILKRGRTGRHGAFVYRPALNMACELPGADESSANVKIATRPFPAQSPFSFSHFPVRRIFSHSGKLACARLALASIRIWGCYANAEGARIRGMDVCVSRPLSPFRLRAGGPAAVGRPLVAQSAPK